MTRFGWLAAAMAGLLAASVALGLISAGLSTLWAGLVGVNVATILAYGYDKRVARRRGRRLPEATLHLLAAIGGTPGGLLAQNLFRHKTRDRPFLAVFWTIATLQILTLALLAWLRWGSA